MEIKNIIIHFPWGAGGNFVRNCLTLDSRYEFDNESKQIDYASSLERYELLYNFYNIPVDSESWLYREWQLRGPLYGKYYQHPGYIQSYNPECPVIYLSHCETFELQSIMSGKPLTSSKFISSSQKYSAWTLLDCHHVFLIPTNVQLISQVYISKYKRDNPFTDTVEDRLISYSGYIKTIIETMIYTSDQLQNSGRSVKIYDPSRLFVDTGYNLVLEIAKYFDLTVSEEHVKKLHEIWVMQTNKIYNEFYGKNWE